jgi:hypothetical protein
LVSAFRSSILGLFGEIPWSGCARKNEKNRKHRRK